MSRVRRFGLIIRNVLIVIAVSGLLALLVLFLVSRPTLRVLWQNCQPETVTYDEAQYCLYVIERETDFTGWPLRLGQHYALAVTPGAQTDYGHLVAYSFSNGANDVTAYINESQSEWTADGVTFIEQDGHRLFIPATSFTGGR